jgi:class 3 adenylate cyclase
MNPQVRYAKTRDGVNIAHARVGDGPPIVWMADIPFSHMQFEFQHSLAWQEADWQDFLKQRSLVRFDPRGMGLSDRSVTKLGLDEWLLDLETVMDALRLETFALHAVTNGGSVGIAYAARHPERVSHLILQNTGARPADGFRTPRAQLMGQMLAHDFEMFSENAGGIAFGWGNPMARIFAEFIRAAVTPDVARHSFGALSRVDVTDLLSTIQAPTLILFNDGLKYVTQEMSMDLASRIPNARLVNLSGTMDRVSVGPALMLDFFEEQAVTSSPDASSGTAIILFADIVDSTALTERLGDAAFREKARALDDAMRAGIRANGGTAIDGKTLGDGVLAVFTSAKQAITCAQACHEAARANGLALHAGIHAGDVIHESDNVYGGAVNIAARVAAASAPGETLVSATVRDLARTSAGVAFEDRGEQALKGIEEPVRVYAISWTE